MSQISLRMPVLVILFVWAMTVIAKSDNFSSQQPIAPRYLGRVGVTVTDSDVDGDGFHKAMITKNAFTITAGPRLSPINGHHPSRSLHAHDV